jgi:RNA 2',3'-cyclic 3'-phosphodiesterase
MRCFISLELSKEGIEEVKRIQELLRKRNLFTGKFTELENLHLTIKFLGEIDDRRLGEVKKRLVGLRFHRFSVSLGEIGVFNKKFPRIVWVKLLGKEIFELQKFIDEKLDGLFRLEERFMGHVTIARVKNVGDRKAFLEYLDGSNVRKIKFDVDAVYLKESELKFEGPEYGVIRKYNLERVD